MKPVLSPSFSCAWVLPLLALAGCQPPAAPASPKTVVWVSSAMPASSMSARVFPAVLHPRIESALGFRVGGRIAVRMVEVGQTVRQGQTLAQLATDDVLTGLHAARQQVTGAEVELAQLQADEARLARLVVDGSAPAAELERQRTRVRAAQARLDGARQGEQLAANRVGHATLKAPFDGVVTAVLADAGQVLSEGQPMLTLARAGEMEAEVFLPEELAGRVRQAVASLVMPGAPSAQPVPLVVREIAPMGAGAGRQIRVRYAMKAQAQATTPLRWGQTTEVHWAAGDDGAFSVPVGALIKRDGAPHVWLVAGDDARLVKQSVTVQRYTTDGVVLAGLPAGAKVVSAGAQTLTDGMQVIPRERTHSHLSLDADAEHRP